MGLKDAKGICGAIQLSQSAFEARELIRAVHLTRRSCTVLVTGMGKRPGKGILCCVNSK